MFQETLEREDKRKKRRSLPCRMMYIANCHRNKSAYENYLHVQISVDSTNLLMLSEVFITRVVSTESCSKEIPGMSCEPNFIALHMTEHVMSIDLRKPPLSV